MPSNLSLHVSDEAIDDLVEIDRFTERNWGRHKADEYVESLQSAFNDLCQFPSIGRWRKGIPRGMRIWTAKRHLIFYRAVDTELQIVRVIHERQDISQIKLN